MDSIKLVNEGEDQYLKYAANTLKFWESENEQSLEWNIYLAYWPEMSNQFVIQLGILSSKIYQFDKLQTGGYEPMSVAYVPRIIDNIAKFFDDLQSSLDNSLILLTDEVSEGVFLEGINRKNSTINFLFDLAIIPSDVQWEFNEEKYEILNQQEDFTKYKSKHPYMRLFQ